MPDAIAIGVDNLSALGLAHFLHDDLLGLLCSDAAEGDRLHALLDKTTDFDFPVDVAGVFQAQLALRDFELVGIVSEYLPAAESLVVAALAVDGDPHIPLFPVFLAGSGRERGFESLEDDFFIDALLVRDGIDHHQNFLVHASYPYKNCLNAQLVSGANRAFAISPNGTSTVCLSTSISMPAAATGLQNPRVPLASRPGRLQLHKYPLAHEPLEMSRRPQHPVKTR